MKSEQRIYCVEGHWDYGDRQVEPSVEPMLEQLRRMGLWQYARRDCATMEELRYFLYWEWDRCQRGSILYLASHGAPGEVWLSRDHFATLERLATYLGDTCRDCLVHFGGGEIMAAEEGRLRTFMEKTEAMGVSGYTVDAGGTSALDSNGRRQPPLPEAPAIALELLFFSAIRTEGISLNDGRQFGRLHRLASDLHDRFEECQFKLMTRARRASHRGPGHE